MIPLALVSLVQLIFIKLALTQTDDGFDALQIGEITACNQQSSNQLEFDCTEPPEWEFEPRIWSPDQDENDSEDRDFFPGEGHLASNGEESFSESDTKKLQELQQEENLNNFNPTREELRGESNFYESRVRRFMKPETRPHKSNATRSNLKTRQQQGELECNQFRVDIRETVICDRQRCDKLDFEWPKYDNQMIVVQTTREGMRFYQAHLAFEPAPQRRESSEQTRKKIPIKFDILDLFKPKITTTKSPTTLAPPDSSTTPEATTTSISPATNETTSDQFGLPNGSSSSTAATTTATESTKTEQLDADPEASDNNKTELITTFRLDTRRRMQQILGFGGALSDASCRNIKSLSPTMAKSLMEDYFGPRGIQYSIVRMSMGSSDFSLTPYTNNDKPYGSSRSKTATPTSTRRDSMINETDDVEMKYFHLTEEDLEIKLPTARQAIATSKRRLKFFSSLWSPPIWMKNNSHIVHGYLKGDVYGPYYKALADLIIKWLEAYREQGIEFWATTGLNEPITGIRPFIFHNSLGINRDDYITWFKLYLGPMLKSRGFEEIKLIAVDDNKGFMQNWAGGLLEDGEANKYISGIGVHWYMNDDYENLNFLINKYPDKFILSTEACNGYLPFQVHVLPGDWDRGVAYMLDIMKLIHKNAVGWVDWNMVLDTGGGPSWPGNFVDSPVLVNSDRDEYYKSPAFYAIGHFSRFVIPNSYRLDHRLAYARYDYPLEAAGFHTPDDYIVIVVLNANKHIVPFKIIVDKKLVRVVELREESFNTIVFKWRV